MSFKAVPGRRGAAELSRTASSVPMRVTSGLRGAPRIWDTSRSRDRRPAAQKSWRTVVSGRQSNPLVSQVTVNCDVLDATDRDQQVVTCTAAPVLPFEEALRLLPVIGSRSPQVRQLRARW